MSDKDTIARLDSNKFGIFQANITGLDQVMRLSHNLLNAFSSPFFLDGNEVRVGANLGISIYPDDCQNSDRLLENADIAMHQAKSQGRNTYQFYSTKFNENLQERLALENELYGAIQRQELLLHYQPQVSLATGQIVGVEALLRWQNPLRGMISPAKFIPIAEETGLILTIGEWVLQTACAQNLAWQTAELSPLRMAVNLSARQFKQKNLIEIVMETLARTGLGANYLELELTEGLLIDNVEQSIAILEELHTLGIIFALDDFGTGYSSLSYLKRFPLQSLKIDQSFVRDITIDPNSAAITEAVISLAHSLQLNVIAEGVETKAQWSYLKEKGCEEVQGYYLSRPLPADRLTELLSRT
jgi:EAL domain-containing protein (putative c-di-GMP-specific phosphodiesterase class I)